MAGNPGRRWGGDRRPGASELVLERARGGEHNPFDWLARTVSESSNEVLDLACATGVLARRLAKPGRHIVGVDLSGDNIARARELGGGEFIQADMRFLPFEDGSFDAVVSSLGLGMVDDRDEFLAEAARVLRPGGIFAAITPSLRPLRTEELRLLGRLIRHMKVTPQVPGVAEFRAKKALAAVGLTKVEDSRARYWYSVADRGDAETLLAGLRQATDKGRAAAADFLADRAEGGAFDVPLPMRRIVALK